MAPASRLPVSEITCSISAERKRGASAFLHRALFTPSITQDCIKATHPWSGISISRVSSCALICPGQAWPGRAETVPWWPAATPLLSLRFFAQIYGGFARAYGHSSCAQKQVTEANYPQHTTPVFFGQMACIIDAMHITIL